MGRVVVRASVSKAVDRARPKPTQRSHSGRNASVTFSSMKVAKASFSQMPFHHFIVTRSPNHMWASRSEEHTSELQSLMRNSYAVFCLKKNKNTKTIK